MKRVISTKVDQAKYAEFLQYCAKVNKYPANVLEDALDLLLTKSSNSLGAENKPKIEEMRILSKQEAKPKPEIYEDEAELDL